MKTTSTLHTLKKKQPWIPSIIPKIKREFKKIGNKILSTRREKIYNKLSVKRITQNYNQIVN